ncbi:hypothetical protein EDC56_3753 [Sinobacterium caligoides]|uniref:Outer membrane protein beta-barrel domain-containing protein n=1 Tax=Sinobacterium caligoides TaxID=933926 RepID=A0A3N2D5N5_9GAMM|nr:porin family protein [Sinobacterium caligoides]ROR94938.1 hypothetical protein EDC56_3753 [Sinobacterium caligoides]
MPFSTTKIAAITFASLFSLSALGQQDRAAEAPKALPENEWNILAGVTSFDSDFADSLGVDDTGYLVGAAYTGYFSFLRYSAGGALIILDDKAEFTQRVENVFGGDERDEDSSIDAGMLFAEIGSQYAFGNNDRATVGMMAGYSYFDVERSISLCQDCREDDIEVESSFYLKPFVAYRFTDSFLVRLEYTNYQEEQSFENAITLNFSIL